MINFIWEEGDCLEVRPLDPAADGFTFRISEKRSSAFRQRPQQAECYFLDYDCKKYEQIILTAFTILPEKDETNTIPGAVTLRMRTENTAFLSAMQKLLRQYMAYIHLRLEEDEMDLMAALTDLDLSGQYPASPREWAQSRVACLLTHADDSEPLLPVQLALSLDEPDLWQAFLQKDLTEFRDYYRNVCCLPPTFLSELPLTHLYIGSQFCPLLFPEEKQLAELLQKSCMLKLTPVLVFSHMPQEQLPRLQKILTDLADWAVRAGQELELVINDPGMALMIRRLFPGVFSLTSGVLWNRRKKDARIPYRKGFTDETDGYRLGNTDADFYRHYLRKDLGICRLSYETCGYSFAISGKGNVLHLPLYQMNTSDTCTLYALCKNGDRGRQETLLSCPQFCRDHAVLYPRELPVIGRWNSLFGCDDRAFSVSRLNKMIQSGISRLVIRL